MPYRSRPDQPRNLIAQIEDEMRDRLREALDHVSLEVLVETRRIRGQGHPAADNPADRAEYEAGLRAFLERLDRDVASDAPDDLRRTLADVRTRSGPDPSARLLAVQIALARALPDYWQRFEAIRQAHTAEQVGGQGPSRPGRGGPSAGPEPPKYSGGQRGGLLRQIFGR